MTFEIMLSPSTPTTALPQGETVLFTGVNGYIASHVANQLLELGYRVRGTVRSMEKNKWVQERFDRIYGRDKFELFHVPDLSVAGAFDQAAKGRQRMSWEIMHRLTISQGYVLLLILRIYIPSARTRLLWTSQ